MKIVPREAWEELQRKAKWWWAGWTMALVALITIVGVTIQVTRVTSQLRELQIRQDALDQTTYRTAKVQENVGNQQFKASENLLEAAALVQTRLEIKDFNHDCGSVPVLTKRPRTGMVTP